VLLFGDGQALGQDLFADLELSDGGISHYAQ
jgi:hypothetical protein